MGCGQPAGEAGLQHRPASSRILAGIDDVPGVTVNRYCSSSLQTIRMAAHAIKAGEGDVFIAGGVETVSRFSNGAADTGPPNDEVRRRRTARTKPRAERRPADVDAAGRPARRLHRDGPDRRERAEVERRHPRGDGRVRARCRSSAPSPASEQRLLRARDHAGHAARRHGRVARTTAPAPAPPSRSSRSSSRCSAPTARSPPATPAR